MSHTVSNIYEVYHDAENIRLEEITWDSEEIGNPSAKVKVLIDGKIIENVTFQRDITSKAYAMPPFEHEAQSPGITILFGGLVQEILDHFADYILPPMKPLGLNPLTGETVFNAEDRTDASAIENAKQKIERYKFLWENDLMKVRNDIDIESRTNDTEVLCSMRFRLPMLSEKALINLSE